MSLTEAEQVFGGITEGGFNDLLRAFFTARPRYLVHGSPGFVPATTVAQTQIPSIPFPGAPGGIDWMVELSLPVADFHPQTGALPPELSLAVGQLSVTTTVMLCVACRSRREQERDERDEGDEGDEHREEERPDHDRRVEGTCFKLEVSALAHLERTFAPDGVIIVVDDVEIVDISPEELEAVIECLLLQILRAVLSQVRLPLSTLRAGAFSLTLTRGPEVEDDQTKVYGNL